MRGKDMEILNFMPKQVFENYPLILITSPFNEWQISPKNLIFIDKFTKEEAEIYFCKLFYHHLNQHPTQQTKTALRNLAKHLQYHPLMMQLASACCFEENLTKTESQMQALTNAVTSLHAAATSNEDVSMTILEKILHILFHKLEFLELGKESLTLLNTLAYLPPERMIPNPAIDKLSTSTHFELLEKYSIISRTGPILTVSAEENLHEFTIHRIIQHYVRQSLGMQNDHGYLLRLAAFIALDTCDNGYIENEIICVHRHLKQRNWPSGSLQYSLLFAAKLIVKMEAISGIRSAWEVLQDAYCFMESNITASFICIDTKSALQLLHLCLYYFRVCHMYDNETITKRMKLCEIDLDSSVELALESFSSDRRRYKMLNKKNMSNTVRIKVLMWGLRYKILKKLWICAAYNHKKSIKLKIAGLLLKEEHWTNCDTIPKVHAMYQKLWDYCLDADLVCKMIQVSCDKHNRFYPSLEEGQHTIKEMYWENGGPFPQEEILKQLLCKNADRSNFWDEDFKTAIFKSYIEDGGLAIIAQQMNYWTDSKRVFEGAPVVFQLLACLSFQWNCAEAIASTTNLFYYFNQLTKLIFSGKKEHAIETKFWCIVTCLALFSKFETLQDSSYNDWTISSFVKELQEIHDMIADGILKDLKTPAAELHLPYVEILQSFLSTNSQQRCHLADSTANQLLLIWKAMINKENEIDTMGFDAEQERIIQFKMASASSFAIGIDFGNTQCCVAVLRYTNKKPEVIPNNCGQNQTPSYVNYEEIKEDEENACSGETAKHLAIDDPQNTIFHIKRLIGQLYYDQTIQKYRHLWPFQLVSVNGMVGVKVRDETLLPETIAAKLVSYLKEGTEDYLGQVIDSVVVAVPVYFQSLQIGLTKKACAKAGFKNIKFIFEPVAAAVAYGLHTSIQSDETKTCLIFDLGGCALNVTILRLYSNKQVEIITTGQDDQLGGDHFDKLLTEYCVSEYLKLYSIDLAEGQTQTSDDVEIRRRATRRMHRIRNECEKQKCYLSSVSKVAIQLDAIHKTHPLNDKMTRSFFENLISVPLARSIQILDETLKKSTLEKDQIDSVVLIGGSSRIPKVQQMVQEYFGRKQICRSILPDEAVACGAAVYAHSVFKENGDLFSVVTSKREKSITTLEDVPTLRTNPHLKLKLPGLIASKTLLPKPAPIIERLSRNVFKNPPDNNPLRLLHVQTDFDSPRTNANLKSDPNANLKPVQIIEISQRNLRKNLGHKVMQKERLTLKTDNLAAILSQVGSRPVALLSIVGPSRLGKSFLLSYMVKYLRTHSASDTSSVPHSDWIGKSRDESLREGFGWRSRTEAKTLGIWMWSEPFRLRADDGSEFDVLLMDTQGIFESHTDTKDWSTIVGLSLLTSSCLIFNIGKLLEEHILNSLKKFMDFGLMARDSSSDQETNASKPFQKLVFLVRDWNCPDDHPYGVAGGATYLNSKLNEETTEDGEEIRTQIKSCFEQLDCCLMSDPRKLVKPNSYDGSVAKMDTDFAANIQEFIENLFRPSSLAPKYILGNPVTGEDLLVYFKQLVNVFNGEEMPSNQELTQATVNSVNQAVVNSCFQTYKNSFEQFQKPELRTFLLGEELSDLSDLASRSSFSKFESVRKMGSLQAVATAKGELTKICDQFKNEFLVSNVNARNQQVQLAEEKLHAFLETRLKELVRKKSMGRDEFVSEDVLLTICANCKMEGQTMLLKFLGLQSLNALPNVDQKKLEGVTLAFIKSAQNINEGKKLKALAYLKELVADLTNQYKLKMGAIIANHKYWQERELQNEDSALRIKLLKELRSEFSGSSIFAQGEQQLVSATQNEYMPAHKLAQARNENFLITCAQCVSDLSKLYVEEMEKHAMEEVGRGLEGRSMREAHAEAVQDCIRRLNDFEGFARLANQQKTQFEADLHFSIEKNCLHLVEKWSPRKRQNLLKAYKKRLNEAYGSGRSSFGSGKLLDLEEKHSIEKTRVMNNFTEFLSQLPISQEAHEKLFTVTNLMLTDFETELENHMADIRKKEKLRVDALQETAQGFLAEAKTKFLESAQANNRACPDHETYKLKFDEAKLQAMQNLKDKCHKNHLPSPQQSFTEDLDNFIKSVPQFKTLHRGEVLEISGPSLKLSRELDVLENILESSLATIKEVRFIASDEIALDENICSEFWHGKNLLMYTKKMNVSGSDRIIDVSGKNGKSVFNASVPPTPKEPGKNGQNGVDGEPGESGGNVVLLATTILNPCNLKIISNGGAGGSGGGGGDGSPGVDGMDGDSRFHLSLKDLEENFPSPAKFFDQVEKCVDKGRLSLARIAKGRHLKTLGVANSNNYCFELETEEGARLRYGFFQGKLKGLISGRSFYIWCRGAPGTIGQPGGFGGLGGRGGSLGNPGAIDVPEEVASNIMMIRKPGYSGRSGPPGAAGKDGVCGLQGTDYAIVDPYEGLWIPTANLLSKRWFQGNLEMVVVEEAVVYKNFARCVNAWNKPFRWATSISSPGEVTESSIPTIDDAAFCPNQNKFISFMSSLDIREALKVHPEPEEAQCSKPLKKTRNKQPIDKSSLVDTYGQF